VHLDLIYNTPHVCWEKLFDKGVISISEKQ